MTLMTSDTDFKVTPFFEVEYCKKRRVLETKLLLQKRKLYITYGMVLWFGDLGWPLNVSRGLVSISFLSS